LNTGTIIYLQGIHTRRQDEKDGRRWACFLKRLRKLYCPGFNILSSEFLFYEGSEVEITRNIKCTNIKY
jgi:hypothetical protein